MYKLLVSAFGVGYSPWAPGTCGSAVVTVLFIAVAMLAGSDGVVAGVLVGGIIYGGVVTVVCGKKAIAHYGDDPCVIVSDEVCGQAIAYLWLWQWSDWSNQQIIIFALAGLALFRLFDITKPPPVNLLDRINNAWGVLLDDVMAGVYANIALQIIWRLGILRFLWD